MNDNYEIPQGAVRLQPGDVINHDGTQHIVLRVNDSGAVIRTLAQRSKTIKPLMGDEVSFNAPVRQVSICNHCEPKSIIERRGEAGIEFLLTKATRQKNQKSSGEQNQINEMKSDTIEATAKTKRPARGGLAAQVRDAKLKGASATLTDEEKAAAKAELSGETERIKHEKQQVKDAKIKAAADKKAEKEQKAQAAKEVKAQKQADAKAKKESDKAAKIAANEARKASGASKRKSDGKTASTRTPRGEGKWVGWTDYIKKQAQDPEAKFADAFEKIKAKFPGSPKSRANKIFDAAKKEAKAEAKEAIAA
jgi:hypothetical protein